MKKIITNSIVLFLLCSKAIFAQTLVFNESIDLNNYSYSSAMGKLYAGSNAPVPYGQFLSFGIGGYSTQFNSEHYANGKTYVRVNGDGGFGSWNYLYHSGMLEMIKTDLGLNLQEITNLGNVISKNLTSVDPFFIKMKNTQASPNTLGLGVHGANGYAYIQASKEGVTYDNPIALQPNGGNVGIGVTAPEAKLHTSGDRVMFTRSGGEHHLLFGDESARYFSLYTPEGAARATLKNYTNNIDIITFLQDGNVGIGTDAPQEKLSVNGRVRAKEIKVETANWPDYVFADDYQQQTLPELEQFIKKNKHLPEVPSAKEAEQNGVALGEMNKILLKKIEELTLHLIEKDKTLTELTKRVERLEKKN